MKILSVNSPGHYPPLRKIPDQLCFMLPRFHSELKLFNFTHSVSIYLRKPNL